MDHREVRFDSVGGEGREFSFEIPAGEVTRLLRRSGVSEPTASGPLKSTVRILGEGDEYSVSGHSEAAVEFSCVRCLEAVLLDISYDYSMKIVRGGTRSGMEGESELELKASDLDVEAFDGESVDLVWLAVEQLLINLPQYPLCDESCKGLCPTCGAELNKGRCRCAGEGSVDPRLKVLQTLKR